MGPGPKASHQTLHILFSFVICVCLAFLILGFYSLPLSDPKWAGPQVLHSEIWPCSFLIVYQAYIRPHLEYCVQSWTSGLAKDTTCLLRIQMHATKLFDSLSKVSSSEQLNTLVVLTISTGCLRSDLIKTYKWCSHEEGIDLNQFHSNHVLHPYLPSNTDIPYQLRTRFHRMTLINKTKHLNEADFIIRLLYKHSY